jgi:hypothetical protein
VYSVGDLSCFKFIITQVFCGIGMLLGKLATEFPVICMCFAFMHVEDFKMFKSFENNLTDAVGVVHVSLKPLGSGRSVDFLKNADIWQS